MINLQFKGLGKEQRNWGDCLTVRFRRMVQSVIEEERNVSYWSQWNNKYKHQILKLFWVVLILSTTAAFCYQIMDRIQYYFTYPVTTVIEITKKNYHALPEITSCYPATPVTVELYRNLSLKRCDPIPINILLKSKKFTLEEVWTKLNTSTAILSAKEIDEEENDLTYSNIPLLDGTCTTFRSKRQRPISTDKGRVEVIFKRFYQKCAKEINSEHCIHEPGDDPLARTWEMARDGSVFKIGITVRQYNFKNRTSNPCVSHSEYRNCYRKCNAQHFIGIGRRCRLPFYPESMKLPKCNTSKSIYGKWWNDRLYFSGRRPRKECVCTRKCSARIFATKITSINQPSNTSILVVYIEDPHETEIREEFIYDSIKLLSDIGGNSGLWIGLSMLSVFQFVYVLLHTRKKKQVYSDADPLFRKVLKTYNKFKKQTKDKKKQLKRCSVIDCVLYICCICIFLLGVVARTSLFLSNPKRRVVDISFNDSLETPRVTLCSGDPQLLKVQKKFAKFHGISNYCDVQLWELINFQGFSATDIFFNPKIAKGQPTLHSTTVVSTYEGTCLILNDEVKGSLMAPARRIIWKKSFLPAVCGTSYQQVYVRPREGYDEYLYCRYVIHNHRNAIRYGIKEIVTDEKDCVQEREYSRCITSCRTGKLLQQISCRLPYMLDVNLTLCNSSITAKHPHLTYMKLFVYPGSKEDCDCSPPCIQRIYNTVINSQPSSIREPQFTLAASNNVIETHRSESAYTPIAYLCDIGGWLGSTLGLSIFTGADKVLLMISTVFKDHIRNR